MNNSEGSIRSVQLNYAIRERSNWYALLNVRGRLDAWQLYMGRFISATLCGHLLLSESFLFLGEVSHPTSAVLAMFAMFAVLLLLLLVIETAHRASRDHHFTTAIVDLADQGDERLSFHQCGRAELRPYPTLAPSAVHIVRFGGRVRHALTTSVEQTDAELPVHRLCTGRLAV